jgi:c-di-GMP-binding flagellar brake protein YcgR
MYKNERRIFERFEADFPVEIERLGLEENEQGQCCDISAGGIGMLTDDGLIPNTVLRILLCFSDARPPLRSSARVIWSKQVQQQRWRSGLKFTRVDLMGLRRIFEKPEKKT